jgi:DnaJ-class molecular chaperone
MNRNRKIDKARNTLGMCAKDGAEEAKRLYREMAKIWHPALKKENGQ